MSRPTSEQRTMRSIIGPTRHEEFVITLADAKVRIDEALRAGGPLAARMAISDAEKLLRAATDLTMREHQADGPGTFTPDAQALIDEMRPCPDCGHHHNESYCPVCEEMP